MRRDLGDASSSFAAEGRQRGRGMHLLIFRTRDGRRASKQTHSPPGGIAVDIHERRSPSAAVEMVANKGEGRESPLAVVETV